jgi:phage head maturation protease
MTTPNDFELLVRNDSVIADVNQRLRLIDLIVVPWDQEAEVPWHGEMWRETFQRGAFDGIEGHAGRIRVNREHVKGDTVGRAVSLDPQAAEGLLARLKIAATARGDDTLELAADDMLSPSAGFYNKSPSDVTVNRRNLTRRVLRAFLDHIAMVEAPAYAGARVLAVREEQSGLATVETPLYAAPALDEAINDPVFQWAAARVAKSESE